MCEPWGTGHPDYSQKAIEKKDDLKSMQLYIEKLEKRIKELENKK